jgi:hypothetical protein
MLRPIARQRRFERRLRLVGAALALALAGVRDASEGSGQQNGQATSWQPGRPTPVAVKGGFARFTVRASHPGARTLVIVSSLARAPGPFPVRLTARPVSPESCREPEIAVEASAPPRAPRLSPPHLPAVPAPSGGQPPLERTFHLMVRDGDVASASNYLAVTGQLRAVGRRVQVYVDADDRKSVGPELLRDVVRTFDSRVFPVAARTIGQARDVDGDGRFTVFITSWLTRLAGGKHVVDGFVRGADLEPNIPAPFSNHGDMMYLSTAMGPGPHLRTVMAHEYTHAVTFCSRAYPPRGGDAPWPDEEAWLDEALAHLVEDLHGFSRTNLDYRVSAFLSQPERYRLVVEDYYAADLFRSHGNRGATYLFLRWCADRYGPELLPTLLASDRHGVANLEEATGTNFDELYRAWSVALFLSGFDPSLGQTAGYRAFETRGPFDDWELAGPRTTPVRPGGPPAEWASAGTASRYLVVGPSPTAAVEVEVAGPAEAALQVTAVPLPEALAGLELEVERATTREGVSGLRFRLRETHGTAVRLTSLSWEPLVPGADPHADGFRHDGLDQLGIASEFGNSLLPANGRLESRTVRAAVAVASGRPLVIKAVGTDANGRRVSAWADLPAPSAGSVAGPPSIDRRFSTPTDPSRPRKSN